MRPAWVTGLVTGVVVGLAVLVANRTLQAQGGAPATGRFACVDVIRCLNEYQRQKDLIEEVNQITEKVQEEDKQRRAKIDTLQAEVERMNPEDPLMVQRMREMLALQIDFKNWRDLKQADLSRELGLWSIRLYRELVRTVEDIAKRDGYDLVLYRGQFETVSMDPEVIKEQIRSLHLLYANPTIDITQAVLDKLNNDYRALPRQPMLMQ